MFIFSQLIPATISELDKYMSQDESLRILLTTKGSNLPEAYRYLMSEELNDWKDKTLYDLIMLPINANSFVNNKELISFFSTSGNKLVGWCAYEVDTSKGNRSYNFVSNIKMFSFDTTRPNPVLLRDLDELVSELMDEYQEVSWIALKENPANKIYRKAIEKYNGECIELDNCYVYRV